ncbi:RraA family protein [Uliginosibacterium sp. sgz301328]|uniref:RraA family protein n=1 Tax=Uliginosibacterium sp. sgz301328 TaxID=3243764 RepID=UPI00359F0A73
MWKDDQELFALMRGQLFTAVVGDILDNMGLLHQFLQPQIKPLCKRMVVAGRAMPVLEADYFAMREESGRLPLSTQPFGIMFAALDDLKQDEVYITTGSSPRYALWGGLMSTRAMHLKAAGVVADGYVRDSAEIEEIGFPTFSLGTYAQDQGQRGKVVDFRVPIEINNIRVRPGDIVFGDRDGVLIVPREAEREAISLALEKVSTESAVRRAIREGMSTVDAFERFGVM